MAVLLQDGAVNEAREKLDEIIMFCEMEDLTGLRRAHQILKRTREVSGLLQVELNFQLIPALGLRIPDEYWPFVYACAQTVLRQELTLRENREEVGQNLLQIYCAMEMVRDYFLAQSSTSETTTTCPYSSQSTLITVTLKHFLEGGGIRSLSEQFHEVPTYSKLHDLGAKLLIENDLDVCDFDLLWDGDQKLENMNTPATLRHFLQSASIQPIPEVPEVCIFLKLRRTSLPRSRWHHRIYRPALEPPQPHPDPRHSLIPTLTGMLAVMASLMLAAAKIPFLESLGLGDLRSLVTRMLLDIKPFNERKGSGGCMTISQTCEPETPTKVFDPSVSEELDMREQAHERILRDLTTAIEHRVKLAKLEKLEKLEREASENEWIGILKLAFPLFMTFMR